MHQHKFLASAATLGLGLTLIASAAAAADIDDVKAADQAFHAALSAMDGKAMAAVWANKPYVTNIGPSSKAPLVGYTEAVTQWIATVVPGRFSELKAQMTTVSSIQVNGNVAWIVGIENATGKNKAGEPLSFDTLVTDVFEKDGGKWLMVSHHAQIPPK